MFTVKQINAKSMSLGKATKGLQAAIHNHALVIIEHISLHGDVTIATNLVNALGSGTRKNALRQWFIDFGGCSWNAEKEAFGRSKKTNPDLINGALHPFYDYVPETKFQPIDGAALIRAAIAGIKKAQKLLDAGELTEAQKSKVKNCDPELLAKLEALV